MWWLDLSSRWSTSTHGGGDGLRSAAPHRTGIARCENPGPGFSSFSRPGGGAPLTLLIVVVLHLPDRLDAHITHVGAGDSSGRAFLNPMTGKIGTDLPRYPNHFLRRGERAGRDLPLHRNPGCR